MTVAFLATDGVSGRPLVVLRDDAGRYVLPLPIDPDDAVAIAAARVPGTVAPGHSLLLAVVSSLGARLHHVAIGENSPRARSESLAAALVLTGQRRIAARPGQAISLALRAGAPLHVSPRALRGRVAPPDLFDGANKLWRTSDPMQEAVDEFTAFLEHTSAADFDGRTG